MLRAHMPATFGRYYEPFAGGAALFFDVAPERAVLADSNADLMACYRALSGETEAVIELLFRHEFDHSPTHFEDIRRTWNRIGRTYGRARDVIWSGAAFIYLNKTCFNGLWRVNQKGEFNVGWGKRKRFTPEVGKLRAASRALARAELRTEGYFESVADAQRGDFVYFDPPYDGTFSAYTVGGFGDVHQAELAYTVRMLADRGVQVMVSNADTPRIRALYAGMEIDVVQRNGTMNSDGAKRGKVDEVIIMAGHGWRHRK